MPLLRYDIDSGVVDLEQQAIDLIKDHEPKNGYYVGFSGGKDSIVILDLIKRAGVKYDAHFSMTTVDPPEIRDFIKKYYPDVIWDKPKESMFRLIRKKKLLPTRMKRFCCYYLKELGGKGRVVVVGTRAEESPRRKIQKLFERSQRDRKKWFLRPIHFWSEEEVWTYIRNYKMPYCKLYDEGYNRIGCILCPVQTLTGKLKDIERFPKYYKAYLNAIKSIMDEPRIRQYGDTPEDIMYWWVYQEKAIEEKTIQVKLL
jgi:phosphoadenosine phosphosulfate reductase